LPRQNKPEILVGFENSDDAGVFRLTTDIAVVQTVDFFPPIVDDPFVYGQIAAANALSDIYAMGGEPKTALSIVGFPSSGLEFSIMGDIMKGGLDKLEEAGVALLGGHTVRDEEIKFGYAVTGTIHPDQIKKNADAQKADRLILTKPIGTGLITTAAKKGHAAAEHVATAIEAMVQLNRKSSEVALRFRVHTMTDITGFGLAGHICEVAKASHVRINLDHRSLPLLPGALDYSRAGYCAAGLTSNRNYFEKHVVISSEVNSDYQNVLFDPQTSGGLLLFVDPSDALAVLSTLHAAGIDAVEVGFASDGEDHLLTVS
jgi:selenide,water dikinase